MWKSIGLSAVLMACGSVKSSNMNSPDGGGQPGDGGSTPCTRTTCTNGVLEVCGASGMVDHMEQCALGCVSDESRCNEVAPSNGLGPALDQAAQQDAITLPAGAAVDTDTGAVTTSLGTPIAVTSSTVAQPGGAMLRVLLARSWTLGDVRVQGTLPLAFVSSDTLQVQGVIDASADGNTSGPGGLVCDVASGAGGMPGSGFFVRAPAGNSGGYPAFLWITNGFGGGGFGTAGGIGGLADSNFPVGPPGIANGDAELVPLRGGCQGGGGGGGNTPDPLHRGAGGGAIQLVSGRAVHLVSGGVVHVGGGRGVAGALGRVSDTDTSPVWGPAGGGSGGGILIEAPSVVIDDGAGLIATGGGGGGYGACTPGPDGADAAPSAAIPAGGACPAGTNPASVGGAGATTGAGAAGGATAVTDGGSAGGGGGGLGRIRINTADGLYTASVSSLVRGVATAGRVGRR